MWSLCPCVQTTCVISSGFIENFFNSVCDKIQKMQTFQYKTVGPIQWMYNLPTCYYFITVPSGSCINYCTAILPFHQCASAISQRSFLIFHLWIAIKKNDNFIFKCSRCIHIVYLLQSTAQFSKIHSIPMEFVYKTNLNCHSYEENEEKEIICYSNDA